MLEVEDDRSFYLFLDGQLRNVSENDWRNMVGDQIPTAPLEHINERFFYNKTEGPQLGAEHPLIRGIEGKLCLVDGGKKRLIPDEKVFREYSFSSAKVKDIGGDAEKMADGPDVVG